MPTNRRRLHKASGVGWGWEGAGGLNCNHMTQPCPTGQQMPVCMLMVGKKKMTVIIKKKQQQGLEEEAEQDIPAPVCHARGRIWWSV